MLWSAPHRNHDAHPKKNPASQKASPGSWASSLAVLVKRPQAEQIGAAQSIASTLNQTRSSEYVQFQQADAAYTRISSAISPSTKKMNADTPCTQRKGSQRVTLSPSHTTGALASIIPKVVPATTHQYAW